MNKRIILTVILITLSFNTLYSYEGGQGFSILDLKVGGKAVAMGGAFTAIADDATALLWNPAGLALIDGDELTLFYDALDGFFYHHAYIGYGRTLSKTIAIGFGLKAILSGMQENNDGSADTTFYENQFMVAAGMSFSFPFRLKAGITLKTAFKKFTWEGNNSDGSGDFDAHFFNIDIGLLYPVSDSFHLGIKVENLFPNVSFGYSDGDEKVYTKLVFGSSLQLFDGKFRLSLDLEYLPTPSFFEYRLGLEYRLFSKFSLYAGLDGIAFSFGMNYYLTDFSFYGVARIQSGMDPGMSFGLHYKIGKKKREYKSIEYQMKELSKGLDRFAKGDYKKARRAFKKVLKENPKNKTALRLDTICKNRMGSGDWRTEKDKNYINKHFEAGLRLFRAKEYPEARKRFKLVLEVDPLHWKSRDYIEQIDKKIRNRVRKHFRTAVNAFIRNNLNKAKLSLRRVLNLQPEHSQARDLLARVRRLQKEAFEKGQKQKRRIENAEIYYRRGMAFFKRRIYFDARESYRISLSYLKSKKAQYYHDLCSRRLSKMKIREKDAGKSRDLYDEGIKQLQKKKNVRAAIGMLEKSLNYDPSNKLAEKKLVQLRKSILKLVKKPFDDGVSKFNKGEYIQAMKLWKKALKIDPDFAPARQYIKNTAGVMRKQSRENFRLAEIHYKRGVKMGDSKQGTDQILEAMRYYKNAYELWSKNKKAKLGWERCAARLEKKARDFYSKGYEALKTNKKERLQDAIDYFERYLLMKPGHIQAQKYLADAKRRRKKLAWYFTVKNLLNAGFRLFNNRDYRRALENFKKVQVYDPRNKYAKRYIKQCNVRLKLLAGRNAVMNIFNDGIRHFKIRKYDEAIKTWKRILKLPSATESDKKNVESYIKTAIEVRKYNQNKFFIRGQEFARAGRLLESKEALEEALKINKQHSKARKLLSDVNDRIRSVAFRKLKEGKKLFLAGDYQKSVTVLDEAKKYRADDQRINDQLDESKMTLRLKENADRLLKAGKKQDAIVAYEKVVQNNPADRSVRKTIASLSSQLADQSADFIQKAKVAYQKKNYNDALITINLVLKLVHHIKDPQSRKVTARFAQKRKVEIKNAITKAVRSNYNFGVSYYARRNYKTALRYLNIVYRYDRNYKNTRVYRRIAANAVAAAARRAAQKQQGRIQALLYQGITLYRQGKYRTAIAIWSRILAISPGHSAARSYIARARFKLGR